MSELYRRAAKIMLIRHAEKPPGSPPPHGVNADGERDKESLTVKGWQRAGALASLFAPAGGTCADPSLAEPQFIYASKPTKRNGSRRPLETVTPLAEKLAIRINSNFPKAETEAMLDEAFLCEGVVLICWQRELIPEIANLILDDDTTAPQEWPEDRFDVVWVFDREGASAHYSFRQAAQNLLLGDWTIPIKK